MLDIDIDYRNPYAILNRFSEFHAGIMHCHAEYKDSCWFANDSWSCVPSNTICDYPNITTYNPTMQPTISPTVVPTVTPTNPTGNPTISPTFAPTINPSPSSYESMIYSHFGCGQNG